MRETLHTNTPVRPDYAWPEGDLPDQARAIIVGGGVAGCSVAYHLSQLGWKDVVLLEQNQIGGGTTWHAAGMVGQLRTSNSLTTINRYSVELYSQLKEETGHDIGWLQVGSIVLATCEERMTQLRRTASMAKVFGVEAHILGPVEARDRWPLLRNDDVLGAVWLPHDGRCIPGHTAIAMAIAAQNRGVRIVNGIRVEKILIEDGRAHGVVTNRGSVKAEFVILTGGMWTRQLALEAGIDVPLYPVEHHYIISEPIEGADRFLPCGRDPDRAIYFRTLDDGAIKLGAFQRRSTAWMVERVPGDFSCQLLDADWERFQEPLEAAKYRIPALQAARFPVFVNGPESFTPDNQFIIGRPPGTEGVFVLAGFNSVGIACAGGAGKVAAEWLDGGSPPMDLWSVDIRRFLPFQNDRAYLRERVTETLGLHYSMAWPNREYETARGLRRTPLYDRLHECNACFGMAMGWERANWFAAAGVEPVVDYSFGRQNWAPYVAAEVRACRERVAVLDQSTFSKFILRGAGALSSLQRLCGANVDVAPERIVYTGLFNERGGFESDLTVVRMAEDVFYLVSASSQTVRDHDWIQRHLQPSTELADVSVGYAVVSVMGPRSRELLQLLVSADLANEAFPFGTFQPLEIAGRQAWGLRVSYVGELGWELHAAFDDIPPIYDAIVAEGEGFGLGHVGVYAIHAMRLEKAYRAWGHELSPDDTPLEAGLAFAVDWEKEDFIGREALLEQWAHGVRKRLITLVLEDPEPVLWGNEPVYHRGVLAGYTTSGGYSPTLGAGIGMGYIKHPHGEVVTPAYLKEGPYEVVVDGRRYAASAHLQAPYDPKREKLLG